MMNTLNIEQIASEKIQQMHESGKVKQHIEESVEKLVLESISRALDSYAVRQGIEDAVKKGVSEIAAEVNFSAYNGFISDKIKHLTEGILRDDIAQKLQTAFDNLFLKKVEKVKLSEILETYRAWICDCVDEEEKYSLEHYYGECEQSEYGWLTFTLAKDKPTSLYGLPNDEYGFRFTLHENKHGDNKGLWWIGSAYLERADLKKVVVFKNMSSFEIYILNLLYNETPVEVDIDPDDIDTSFDIDI